MASRNFAINTKPHEAVIGDTTIYLEPEVIGAEFAEAYDGIREVQQRLKSATGNKASSTKHAKEDTVDSKAMAELSTAMNSFVRKFVVETSKPDFDRLRLPDRILTQLIEYVGELYGGGSGNQDVAGGTSTT